MVFESRKSDIRYRMILSSIKKKIKLKKVEEKQEWTRVKRFHHSHIGLVRPNSRDIPKFEITKIILKWSQACLENFNKTLQELKTLIYVTKY